MTILDEVFAVFEANPGRPMSVGILREKTLRSQRQVRDAVGVLRKRGVNLSAIAVGGPWVYQGPLAASSPGEALRKVAEGNSAALSAAAKARPRAYVQMGTTSEGDPIIRDEDGAFYTAIKL